MNEEITIKEVYVSIVTLPKLEELEVGSETFDRFKSTYTEYKEYLNDKQVVQSYFDDAGKSVAFCKVHQIAVGFLYDDTVRVNVLIGEEANIINEFHNLSLLRARHLKKIFCPYNWTQFRSSDK